MTQENTALIKISPETDEAVVALVNEVSGSTKWFYFR